MQSFILLSIGFFVFVVLTQSAHLFPGAMFSLFQSSKRDPKTLPDGVESIFVETSDGKRLEAWRLPADESIRKPFIGIVFHGNGTSLEGFFLTQIWFQEMGITSYGFDYRGFGRSSGWPSEKGIALDSDAVWEYLIKRENVTADQVIVLGVSVGGAPAARIASIHHPKALVLVSAFTDLRQVVRDRLATRIFASFVWHKFPTIDYVKLLNQTKLILASATNDDTVLPKHSTALEQAYTGSNKPVHLVCPESGHNGIFYSLRRELTDAVLKSIA